MLIASLIAATPSVIGSLGKESTPSEGAAAGAGAVSSAAPSEGAAAGTLGKESTPSKAHEEVLEATAAGGSG